MNIGRKSEQKVIDANKEAARSRFLQVNVLRWP